MYLGQVRNVTNAFTWLSPSCQSDIADYSLPGPVFRRHVAAGEKRPFKGSVMVLNDTTKENIWKKLATDVYVTENIWDLEKAQIIPFQTVLRLGHEHASQ